jgi:hypothetical protein
LEENPEKDRLHFSKKHFQKARVQVWLSGSSFKAQTIKLWSAILVYSVYIAQMVLWFFR